VGAVADVEVNASNGKIRVTRFSIVHDCGQIINPDGIRYRSTVTSRDWATYPILRFPDIPDIEIDLISRPTEPPWGAGEATAAIVPAAISNAVFDAAGIRLRSVPFKPEKVKAASAQVYR
jgi:CO/xanthine dehydrogenase Mo-binding subunit